jgi:hypothetical protein
MRDPEMIFFAVVFAAIRFPHQPIPQAQYLSNGLLQTNFKAIIKLSVSATLFNIGQSETDLQLGERQNTEMEPARNTD